MAEILTAKSLVPQLELLKHQLQRLLTDESAKPVAVAITSCESREGVTTLASNLAASLARDAKVDVLLVDGNPANKGVHKYLREKDLPEVSHTLDDTPATEWPVHQLTENLGLLCAKKQKRSGSDDTFFHGINGSLETAKSKYKFVVLDCPPIRHMYSSLHIFKKVDGVILVIEVERVRYEVIEREVSMLREAGANILGTVLNKRRFPIPKFIYRRL